MRRCVAQHLRAPLRRLVRGWEALQIELHGQYSLSRFDEFVAFEPNTSGLQAAAIVLSTPLSCIAAIIVVDVLPLQPPAAGVAHQTATYWIRQFLSIAFVTATVILQFFYASPGLPMTNTHHIVATVILSAAGTLFALVVHHLIGFPTPFLYQMIGPPWQGCVFLSLWLMWKTSIRENPEQGRNILQYLWLFTCQYMMLLLYPVMIFVFGTLGSFHQTVFSLCLPMIKILLKNWASRGVYRLEDTAAVYVVLSVDVFHALLLSCAMKSAVSRVTLIAVMAVDAFQSGVAVMEIQAIVRRLGQLRLQIDKLSPGNILAQKIGVVVTAHAILTSNPRVRNDPAVAFPRHVRRSRRRLLSRFNTSIAPNKIAPLLLGTSREVHVVGPALIGKRNQSVVKTLLSVEVEYVRLSLRLLHMAEFYVLIEFTEVAIALVYAIYLSAMFHLPNRIYYLSLKTLTLGQLKETVVHVLEYAALELLSLVLLVVVLDRLLGFSTLRLLAFTLRKHAVLAQSQLVLWVFFAIQLTLEHLGNDYTFRFQWLHKS